MSLRTWLMLLSIMVIGCTYASARSLMTSDITVMPIDNEIPSESLVSEGFGKNQQLCAICQEYTAEAVDYLAKNETQFEMISALHLACSRLHSFKQKCVLLVDYYAPLFFVEIATIRPEQFCEKVNLCGEMIFAPLPNRDDACTICHHVVDEARLKLQDPDTQLEIIEILLKACNRVENYATRCKKLVLEYGPLILANTEKFLEAKDICVAIHACKTAVREAADIVQVSLSDA